VKKWTLDSFLAALPVLRFTPYKGGVKQKTGLALCLVVLLPL
jgi:hypothetical protein